MLTGGATVTPLVFSTPINTDVPFTVTLPATPGSTGTARTQFIGNYWGYEGTPELGVPPRLYAQIAVELAERGNIKRSIELARYFALVHISMADAGIVVQVVNKVNEGRPMVGHNPRRIGENPDPSSLKFSGKATYDA